VKYNTLFTHEEREGYRKKNPFDSVTEGIGLNRTTANFDQALIDDAIKV
jgi:cysteine synthase A